MKPRSQLRIPKATVKAWAVSFVTLIVVGLIALFIVWAIPSTPFAQIHHLADLNNNNPLIFNTSIYQDNAPIANLWDGVYITGLSFLLSGIPFGWIAGRKGQNPWIVLRSAAVCSVFLSVMIVWIGWLGVIALSRNNYFDNGLNPPTIVPVAGYWEAGAGQTALWTIAFLCGTFLAIKLPRRAASASPKTAPTI